MLIGETVKGPFGGMSGSASADRRTDQNPQLPPESCTGDTVPRWEPSMGIKEFGRIMGLQWEQQYGRAEAQPQPTPPEPISFGQRVRSLRQARGWTQREAAFYLGVCVRTIIRYEQGRTLRPQAVHVVAVHGLESSNPASLVCIRKHGLIPQK